MWWLARLLPLIGNADPGETSDTSIVLILAALAVLVATAILAAVPLVVARRRRARGVSGMFFVGTVWGFAAAGLGLATLFSYAKWSYDNRELMLSGYYDPSTAPLFSWHWPWWGVLGAVYAALLAAAFAGKRRF